MLASCENCRFKTGGEACTLSKAPKENDILCDRYEMNVEFRNQVLELMRQDINREIQEAMLRVQLNEMEKSQGFAG